MIVLEGASFRFRVCRSDAAVIAGTVEVDDVDKSRLVEVDRHVGQYQTPRGGFTSAGRKQYKCHPRSH